MEATTDQQAGGERTRSSTWSSQPSRTEKTAVKKTQTRKEKDIRKSTDDRRQKRGIDILLFNGIISRYASTHSCVRTSASQAHIYLSLLFYCVIFNDELNGSCDCEIV